MGNTLILIGASILVAAASTSLLVALYSMWHESKTAFAILLVMLGATGLVFLGIYIDCGGSLCK